MFVPAESFANIQPGAILRLVMIKLKKNNLYPQSVENLLESVPQKNYEYFTYSWPTELKVLSRMFVCHANYSF